MGEAFRLLTDAVGGTQGASIVPRQPNQGIFQASQRYNTLEDQYNQNLDRLKLTALAQKEKDLQYNMGLQGEQRQRDWQKDTEQRQVAEKRRQDDVNFQQQKELQGERLTADQADRKQQFQNAAALERVQTEEYNKRNKVSTATRTDRTKPMSKDDILFQIPNTLDKIYIGKEELSEMAYRLISEAEKTNPNALRYGLDPNLKILKDYLEGKLVRTENVLQIVKKNWEKAKLALPDFASQASA